MSRRTTLGLTSVLVATLWVSACSSDEPEPNPSFMTGEGGATEGGQSGITDPGPAPALPGGGEGGGTAVEPVTAGAGGAPSPVEPPATAGAAGAAPEVPPYDCVLHPTTHLEIINACTTAVRIEKHPTLPALPE